MKQREQGKSPEEEGRVCAATWAKGMHVAFIPVAETNKQGKYSVHGSVIRLGRKQKPGEFWDKDRTQN